MAKTILVTGAQGFIGRYVQEELEKKGYDIIVFDHHDRANVVASPYHSCQVFQGDVRDATAVTEAMAHADGFIHLAACLGTQETVLNPYPAAETNLLGGINVLQAAAQYNVSGVYITVGNWWMNNPYSITKNALERFVHMYNKERGTRVNIVRAVNAYGPRQLAAAPYGPGKVRKITPAFVCRALSNAPIEVYGDGQQVSDMVYVGDVARALVAALEYADKNEVYIQAIEVGPSESHTVLEVAKLVRSMAHKMYGTSEPNIVHLAMRPGEKEGDKVTADNSTLKLIGIDPSSLMPLEEGMAKTIKYFADSKGNTWGSAHTSNKEDYMELARKRDICCVQGCGNPRFPYCVEHDAP